MRITLNCCIALVVLFLSGSVLGNNTVTRTLSINPYGTHLTDLPGTGPGIVFSTGFSGTSGGLAAIAMPNPNDRRTSFSFGFTLPADYAPGTKIHVRILWRSNATSCEVNLRNNFLHSSQPGKENVNGSFSRLGGVMQAPESTKIANETLFEAVFEGDPVFQAGDAIAGGFFLNETGDTCAEILYIQGISVVYEGLTEGVFADGFEQ